MAADTPPTIDPAAARRWAAGAPPRPPWLHEEVARRMAERLQWIRLEPRAWADWEPVRGGLEGHGLVRKRYPKSAVQVFEPHEGRARVARERLAPAWWRRWQSPEFSVGALEDGAAQMLWANMALHMDPDPQALIGRWHRALAVDGFLMFSCLGPDSLRELRALYGALDWPPPAHAYTDMHDWGDMLVHAGFAEPVMDMERITLTWDSAPRMLGELRELGANLHRDRYPALRGRSWRHQLEHEAQARLAGPDGRIALTFEIIYGHALKPAPRARVAPETAVPLADLRAALHAGRGTGR